MDKRYQIFISSTYEDLKDAREKAQKVILRLSHIPISMELFNPSDKTQWEIIKSEIAKSDYYILIIGQRYGTIDPESKISYTEMEFNYAQSIGVPIYTFILDDSVPVDNRVIDHENYAKLQKFKKKTMNNRMIVHWSTPDDLGSKIMSALYAQFESNPRPGWIRESTRLTIKQSPLSNLLQSTKGEIYIIGITLNSLYNDIVIIRDMLLAGKKVNLMCMTDDRDTLKANCQFLGITNLERLYNNILTFMMRVQERLAPYWTDNLTLRVSRYPIHIGIVGVDIMEPDGFIQATHILYDTDTKETLCTITRNGEPLFDKYKNHLLYYWSQGTIVDLPYITERINLSVQRK